MGCIAFFSSKIHFECTCWVHKNIPYKFFHCGTWHFHAQLGHSYRTLFSKWEDCVVSQITFRNLFINFFWYLWYETEIKHEILVILINIQILTYIWQLNWRWTFFYWLSYFFNKIRSGSVTLWSITWSGNSEGWYFEINTEIKRKTWVILFNIRKLTYIWQLIWLITFMFWMNFL